MTPFEEWLTKKLQELNTDEGVFLPYILGILEGVDESEEEKSEGITGLLADVLDDEAAIEKTLNEILAKWKDGSESGAANVETVAAEVSRMDITHQMHLITQEKIATSKINKTEKTEEEKKIKAAILSGFSAGVEGSDDEEDVGKGNLGLVSNSNAEAVQKVGCQHFQITKYFQFMFQESQEMRERQKEASAAKKEKDKQDRQNQKNQAEERKKKAQEKAAKGERRSGR